MPESPDIGKHYHRPTSHEIGVLSSRSKKQECYSCGAPFDDMDHRRATVGRIEICDWCIDRLNKVGFLQINDDLQMFQDGSIKEGRYEARWIL